MSSQTEDLNGSQSVTFTKYYKKALEVFADDPEQATRFTIKAQLYAAYDMRHATDQTAFQTWFTALGNLKPIYRWAEHHPKVYREILKDTIQWAKRMPPVDFQDDWDQAITSLEQFVNYDGFWKEKEDGVKPENALDTLGKRNEVALIQYRSYLNKEDLEMIKEQLSRIVESYSAREGTVTERMIAVTNEAEEFLDDFMHQNFFSEEGKNSIRSRDAKAMGMLRALSTASATFAATADGKYPNHMKQLMEGPYPYFEDDWCDRVESGFRYTCSMSEDGYQFTATPEVEGTTGSRIYTISTGGVENF